MSNIVKTFIDKLIINIKKINTYDIIIFLLTMFSFLIVLYILFPGILTYDSFYQLQQIENGAFNDWHPFLHTFIEMLCLKVWNSPASIGVFQITIFSIIWTSICKYNRKSNEFKTFIFQVIVTVLICLNPLNPIHAITLWKDIPYSYAILLFCFMMQIGYDKKFKYTTRNLVWLGLIIAFIMRIRYNGVIIAIGMLLILIIILFSTDRNSKNFIKLPIFFVIFTFAFMGLDKMYKVSYNQKDALAEKVVQYTGAFLNAGVVSIDDKSIINNFIDVEKLSESYNPYFADLVYNANFNEEEYQKVKSDVYNILIKYSIKYPGVLKDFALESTTIIWRINNPDNMIGSSIVSTIDTQNNYKDLVHINENKGIYKNFQKTIQYTLNNTVIKAILYNPALYMYLSLILLVIMIFTKKQRKGYIIILLPNLLNIISVIPSLPVQDVRYLYGNFLVLYFIVIVMIKNIFNNPQDTSKNRNSKFIYYN